jgi:chaperonin GroES
MKIKPLSGYALIQPEEEEKQTASGIYLPDTATEKQQVGKVVVVGGPKVTDDGQKIKPEFKEGDRVIFAKWGGEEFKDPQSGIEYKLVKFEDVKAIVVK